MGVWSFYNSLMESKYAVVLSFLVSALVPLALIGLALRLLLTPLYYTIEYNMPYFPADEYGFTRQDRMHWAPFAVNYLTNREDISYLGDLKFEDGSALFNQRELSHMQDVKNVVKGALLAWYVSLAILLVLAFLAWQMDWMPQYLNGLRRGGWWMIWLAVSIAVITGAGMILNPDIFWSFFTLFHGLFFEGDSWLFLYSDTLIRLFPIRFWQDAFLVSAVIALGGGLGLALGLKRFGA
jgi:integral membrane protein (TIGR01906 family)